MEEDINILKDFVKYYEAEALSRKFRGTLNIIVDEDDIQAIENILNRLEELEAQAKCLHCGKEKANYCEKCYQELIMKNAYLQLGKKSE